MAIRIPRRGPNAKASSLADQEFVPSAYLSLGDAVEASGKALFGDSWTGDERTCRYEDINYRQSQDRRTAIRERRIAIFQEDFGQEHCGRDWHNEPDSDLPILRKKELASIQWRLEEKWAARREAERRFDQIVGWLQKRFWSGVIPAVVLTASGTPYPMPTQIWDSYAAPAIFKFGKVEFHPEKYGRTVSPTAAPLKGRVLINREHMVRALSGEDTSPQETPELRQDEARPPDSEQAQLSRREQRKRRTRERTKQWFKMAEEIKADKKRRKAIEIARIIAKRTKTKLAPDTIRRRLDDYQGGWAS